MPRRARGRPPTATSRYLHARAVKRPPTSDEDEDDPVKRSRLDSDSDTHSEEEEEDSSVSGSDEEYTIGEDEEDEGTSVASDEGSPSRLSPTPVWLLQDQDVPPLTLPKSSEDLLIGTEHLLQALTVYEVLRRFTMIVRLTPFRFEDFCAALSSEEHNVLISEIHLALLKALVREDEANNVWFGPQDVRDSINIQLYCIDTITWPEVLRCYVQSDPEFASAWTIVKDGHYPATSLANKLEVLDLLCYRLIMTTAVREDLNNEGEMKSDDVCRECHRRGDLLCCEHCPATYHLGCLDPPLSTVPEDDWICTVCTQNQIPGVYNCVDRDRSVAIIRHEPLGYDRHGRRYYFLVRRIIVEASDGTVYYYSSKPQLIELMEALDQNEYESALCKRLSELSSEVHRQMAITESLTSRFCGSQKTYLDVENITLLKIQSERTEKRNKGENVSDSCEASNDGVLKMEYPDPSIKDDYMGDESGSTHVVTRSMTGSLHRNTNSDLKPTLCIPKKMFVADAEDREDRDKLLDINAKGQIVRKQRPVVKPPVPTVIVEDNSAKLFKLGAEGTFQSYTNYFITNPLALNKNQIAEERDKRRYLSHKFCLSPAAEFKWHGPVYGPPSVLLGTVRQTILQLENNVPNVFFHPNWSAYRNMWLRTTNRSLSVDELVLVLTILEVCLKRNIFTAVWHEGLGHISLHRITSTEREERKKQEKKDRREASEPGDYNMSINYPRYIGNTGHTVFKQKGEEYRVTGRGAWYWQSSRFSTNRVPEPCVGFCGKERPPAMKPVINCKSEDDGSDGIDVMLELVSHSRHLYPRLAVPSKLDSILQMKLDSNDWIPCPVISEVPRSNCMGRRPRKPSKAPVTNKATKAVPDQNLYPEEKKYWRSVLSQVKDAKNLYGCYHCSRLPPIPPAECYSPECRMESSLLKALAGADGKITCKTFHTNHHKLWSSSTDKLKTEKQTVVPASGSNCSASGLVIKSPCGDLKNSVSSQGTKLNSIKKVDTTKCDLPEVPMFSSRHGKKSILHPAVFDLRKLSRKAGVYNVSGFHPNSKPNSWAWPYPCSRPTFGLCWRFRMKCCSNLAAAALHFKILWSTLRWDDILAKPPASGNTLTTESEVISREILSRTDCGPFKMKSMYDIRRIIVPIDVPKPQGGGKSLSFRTGLRERVRAQSPVKRDPVVQHETVPEEELELWEMKAFQDKVEREAILKQKEEKEKQALLEKDKLKIKDQLDSDVKPPRIIISQKRDPASNNLLSQVVLPTLVNGTAMQGGATNAGSGANITLVASPVRSYPGLKKLYTGRPLNFTNGQGSSVVTVVAGGANSAIVNSSTVTLTPTTEKTSVTPTAVKAVTGTGLRPIILQTVGGSSGSPIRLLRTSTGTFLQAQADKPLQAGQQIVRLPDGTLRLITSTIPDPSKQPGSGVTSDSTSTKVSVTSATSSALSTSTSEASIISATPATAKPILLTNTTGTSASPIYQTLRVITTQAGTGSAASPRIITIRPNLLSGGQPIQLSPRFVQAQGIRGSALIQVGGTQQQPKIVLVPSTSSAIGSASISTTTITTTAKLVSGTTTVSSTVQPSVITTSASGIANSREKLFQHAVAQGLQPISTPVSNSITGAQTFVVKTSTGPTRYRLIPCSVPRTVPPSSASPVSAPSTPTSDDSPPRLSNANDTDTSPSKSFVVTTALTQQIIRQALGNPNMTPEVQAKLLAYQRHTQMKALKESVSASTGRDLDRSRENVNVDSPLLNGDIPQRFNRVRLPPLTSEQREDQHRMGVCQQVMRTMLDKLDRSEKTIQKRQKLHDDANVRRKKALSSKRHMLLFKHKELLKTEVLWMRSLMEKEIKTNLQNEGRLDVAAPQSPSRSPMYSSTQKSPSPTRAYLNQGSPVQSSPAPLTTASSPPHPDQKRKSSYSPSPDLSFPLTQLKPLSDESSDFEESEPPLSPPVAKKESKTRASKRKILEARKSRTSESHSRTVSESTEDSHAENDINESGQILYCLCRTPYDEKKFYVGCDRCSNWFHGSCVGISQDQARKMSEWYCPDCKKENGETLYCVCQEPYDDRQTYVGCDRCDDWLHIGCVGIFNTEAKDIEQYVCPRCEPNSQVTITNTVELTDHDISELLRIMVTVKTHRSAGPFRRPVSISDAPDYYKFITEPIDLSKIESRLRQRHYRNLVGFIKDCVRMFDNCRYYCSKNSDAVNKHAAHLEEFIIQKLTSFREQLIQRLVRSK